MCVCIEVRPGYKILIVATIESTITVLDHAAIFFCTSGCVTDGGDINYIRFNLPRLYSKTGFTNPDICCLALATDISNFLYVI